MRLSTYLLTPTIALASADISFGPPPSNPTPVPNPMHPTFAPPPPSISFGPPPSNPTFPVLDPQRPTFFPPPPKEARLSRPTHPLTRRQGIPKPTPFSPFPGGPPGGHVFFEKHAPISTADPSALPPAHPSIIVSDIEHPTYTVLPYTSSVFTGAIQPPSPSEYTGHPSPLPTSSLLTSIVVDTSTPGYSQVTGSHSVSQTIVSTFEIPSTPIAVTPNPGGPMSTASLPPTYLNSTVTTKPVTGLTTSTKITTPPAPSHTGSGTAASGSSTASPSPTTSLGNILEWNAVLAVAGFLGAFAFGMI